MQANNDMMIAATPLPTARDVCRRFGISPATLRRWILRGVFPEPLNLGRKRVWPADIYSRIETQQNNVVNNDSHDQK